MLLKLTSIIILTLTSQVLAQPCGSIVSNDPETYCHQRLAHRHDMDHATPEARKYAHDLCVQQQRLWSGK